MSSVNSFFCASHEAMFFKNSIQRTDKCEHRQVERSFLRPQKTYEVRALKESRKTKVHSFSFNSGEERQTEIELKSLILAQIERWRHALHMQVERQHRELAPGWRVAHG